MNFFPEMSGATLLSVDANGSVTEFPIVGWAYVQGVRVDPLFDVARPSGVGPNEGIRRMNDKGISVVSVPVMRTVMSEDEFYSHMQSLALSGALDDEITEAKANPASVAVAVGLEPVRFDTEAFKTKSYWRMDVARAVFEIEKNLAHPADKRCEKVTRDEYAQLKRDGFAVIDPHNFPGPSKAEEPAAEQSNEDDEFDASNLI